MKIRLLSLLAALLVVASANAQSPKRVLFVGNSYTSVNDLPTMVADVATAMGASLQVEIVAPGGATFAQHCTGTAMQRIRQGGWSAVVLQEQSQLPSFPDNQVANECFPYAKRLVDSIYAHGYCTEPIFYMTWGRKDGDQQNAPYFPPLATYEGMDSLLALRYSQMAAANDASLCPVGRVWRRLRTAHPDIELYQSDGSHPTVVGTYAAACAFYTMLFHRDPDSITFNSTLSPATAQIVRQTVRQVVFDSLSQWQRPEPHFSLGSSLFTTAPNEYCAEVIDMQADSLLWQWGDGSDTIMTLLGDRTLHHLYADTGWFTLEVEARRHCRVAYVVDSFYSAEVDTSEASIRTLSAPTLALRPNPASTTVYVEMDLPMSLLDVCDIQGRLLRRHRPNAHQYLLDVSSLPAGQYLLRVATDRGISTATISVLH